MTDDAQTLHFLLQTGAHAEVLRTIRETEERAGPHYARSIVAVTIGNRSPECDFLGSIANGDHARMAHYLRQVADCVEKAGKGGEGIAVDARLSVKGCAI